MMKASEQTRRRRRSLAVRRAQWVDVVCVTFVLLAASALSAPQAGAAPVPSAATGGVSNLTASSAVLNGSVDPHGQATGYVFQYGTTKAYGAQTPLASAGGGSATVKVAQAISGLASDTTYHYRILATSPAGAAPGGDRTLKTPRIPLSLQIAGVPNPVPFGEPFALTGTLTGTGAGGRVVALQSNPFPYLAGFKTLGNPEQTNSGGGFSFPVVGMLENTQLRVVTTSAPFISSPVLVEGVAVRVSFHVRLLRHHRRHGRFYLMYGTVTPAEVGARVGFQLLRPGLPSLNKGGTFVKSGTASVSRFSTIVRVRRSGVYEALVQVADGSHVSAYSAPLRLR
jgi:hypothetical protein